MLKFSIPGFFWLGKFDKYFLGRLDLSRDFSGIQNNRKIVPAYPSRIVLRIEYNQTCFVVVLMHLFHKALCTSRSVSTKASFN